MNLGGYRTRAPEKNYGQERSNECKESKADPESRRIVQQGIVLLAINTFLNPVEANNVPKQHDCLQEGILQGAYIIAFLVVGYSLYLEECSVLYVECQALGDIKANIHAQEQLQWYLTVFIFFDIQYSTYARNLDGLNC